MNKFKQASEKLVRQKADFEIEQIAKAHKGASAQDIATKFPESLKIVNRMTALNTKIYSSVADLVKSQGVQIFEKSPDQIERLVRDHLVAAGVLVQKRWSHNNQEYLEYFDGAGYFESQHGLYFAAVGIAQTAYLMTIENMPEKNREAEKRNFYNSGNPHGGGTAQALYACQFLAKQDISQALIANAKSYEK
ncbi:MAG: hypothetical protein IJX89_02845 [Alphaproteobacteria bacterium]|nr:hypothetical protein [Alphaproteobacteria bacterium]